MRTLPASLIILALAACGGPGSQTEDGGWVDAGMFDAGTSDAGTFDAGTLDAGASDAGASDACASDAGPFDAGPSDAGAFDAGSFDAGSPATSLLDAASVMASLGSDRTVGAAAEVLASTTLVLTTAKPVLFHAAGNWFTASGVSIGRMQLRVDGAALPGNTSMQFNLAGQRHPFLVNGAETLAAGTHTVELVASRDAGAGTFTVQATAQVTALVGFGDVARLLTPAGASINGVTPVPVASLSRTTTGPIYLEHAGTMQRVSGDGDAIAKIYGDGAWLSDSTFGINDLVTGHDDIAPLGAHALWDPGPGAHTFSLFTHKLDYSYNTVIFNAVPEATLVAAWGHLVGHATTNVLDVPVGNATTTLAVTNFTLPAGHPGRVWMVAQGRWLDLLNSGTGGLESAVLVLDNTQVGPWAVQAFENHMTQSQRNFSLGYLATSLSAGPHSLQLRVAKANPADPAHDLPNFAVSASTVVLW